MGALAWFALVVGGHFREIGEALVALGLATVVPLGAAAAAPPDDEQLGRAFRVFALWAPFGVGLGLAAFVVPPGALAGICATGWFVACAMLSLVGLGRILRRGLTPISELVIDLGHLYLPVGGAWLVATRAGVPFLGFHEPIVLYTANHFHFAGFAAPTIAGLLGRDRSDRSRFVRLEATARLLVAGGVPLVAAGITLSHAVELPAAIVLAMGMIGVAAMAITQGIRRLRRGPPRVSVSGVCLSLGGLSLVVSMSLAVVFASTGSASRGANAPLIPYETMAAIHGVANALGFATLSVIAFTVSPPKPPRPLGGSWPALFGRGFIGPEFFDRVRAIDASREVCGQLASLDAFAHVGFSPDKVDASVRSFYERTAEYTLVVTPNWHRPFRTGGIAFAWFARHFLGQLELPTRSQENDTVATRVFAVRDDIDGRSDVRGYVRTYLDGSVPRANYVASYSTHRTGGRVLLSCAFPLPFACLVGVLRFENGDHTDGLLLTSRPLDDESALDEGMFLMTPLGPMRLPVDEQLDVWPGEGEGTVRARHRVRVFGLRAFTLDYAIRRHVGVDRNSTASAQKALP